MVSLLYRLVGSLSLILMSALIYRLTSGTRQNAAGAPSKGTYRVRNIPARYNTREASRKFIEAILSTSDTPCTIKVRSFAIDHNPAGSMTTGTATFDLEVVRPLRLKPNALSEWSFKVSDNESRQTDGYLIIDTHFIGFTVLSSPEDNDHKFEYLLLHGLKGQLLTDYSLVAISGLGSHAWGSFKKRGETSMWLADKLPRNWSQARIMIYGYRSPIMGSRSRQTLRILPKHSTIILLR
jgi:hypothetical protein